MRSPSLTQVPRRAQEKEELDRRNALREQKRAAIAQKKLDDERKLKADGLEKKRKEREETASKVKAAAAARGAKPKVRLSPSHRFLSASSERVS